MHIPPTCRHVLYLSFTSQAELKEELVPLKKNLRHLYQAKQECDDTTVHMKVSTNTKIQETRGKPA